MQQRNSAMSVKRQAAIQVLCACLLLPACATAVLYDITQPGDPIFGVPNRPGAWPAHESPENAIDDNVNTKYLHFDGNHQAAGFRVTPSGISVPVVGLSFTTANDSPGRDPVAYALYGSNVSIDGPYTLITAGRIEDFDQLSEWPRYTQNETPILFANTTVYQHYQLLFTTVRLPSSANSMQIAEVELLGLMDGHWPPDVDAGPDHIVVLPYTQVQLDGAVSFFADTVPDELAIEWSLRSAPDGVTMDDLTFVPNRFGVDPRVDLPAVSGVYELSLTATTAHHSVSETMRVVVSMSLCPPGDFNRDCRVDFDDLMLLAEYWLRADVPAGGFAGAGGDNEGINHSEFALLAQHWYQTGPPAVISEFLAVNRAKHPLANHEIVDQDGDSSDWIELCNPLCDPIDLEGWYLTDRENDLARWRIPPLTLEPEEFFVIFASGKNRRTPGEPYHTNFSLSSNPDYLALVGPDGQTVVHEYRYPTQYGGVSYGLASPDGRSSVTVDVLSAGAAAYAKIPADDSLGLSWTGVDFEPNGWLTGTTGVGYERQTGYEPWIGLDVEAMYGVNQSVYIRVPFEVDDPSDLENLTLWMMYDDGFAAYVNGMPVASANAPSPLRWNSGSLRSHDAVAYVPFPLSSEAAELLRKGENILSIHGLNRGLYSTDLLIKPRLTASRQRSVVTTSLVEAFFQQPTPGARNTAGHMALGPVVGNVTRNPSPPFESDDLVITAFVEPAGMPIEQVTMTYRVGFGQEVTVSMRDDGQGADDGAGDGVYTAVIPASAYSAGQMVRWYVRAQDVQGIETRKPAFLLTDNSPRYFGTVVRDPSVQPPLQTLYYFVQNTAAEATRGGTRGSVFFLDEFYDNVFIRLRGGFYAESSGSRKIDFNDGEKFRFHPRFDRVNEINLNGEAADISFVRPPLSFETYDAAGLPSSMAFPLRVIRNNSEPVVRMFVEQVQREFLRRNDLDPNGALYKLYTDLNPNLSGEQVERKKSRRDEDNSDLKALAAGIAADNPDRGVFLFDNVNVPAVITYLAVSVLIHENDHTHKNYYLYRDTNTTGEWMFLPWDKDLTFGLNHGISGVIADQDWPEDPLRSPSHPFYGSYFHQKTDLQWNRLFDAVFSDPMARQMYLRRLRTLMDTFLQPPDTPAEQLHYEKRVDELAALIAEELDGPAYWDAVEALKTQYLPVRRTHLYVNHAEGSNWPQAAGIPDAQPEYVTLAIGTIEDNIVSGRRDEDYVQLLNPNPFAADISGWTLNGGGIEHTFAAGTVIPADGTLYLTPNAIAFRNRADSPRGGQYRFVQGNYQGRLSRRGGILTLYDTQHRAVAAKAFDGNPSNAQRYLRITELMYNPSPVEATDFGTQDYEYVELLNIGDAPLPLGGVAFTEGIYYTVPDGVTLAPSGYLILAKEPAAFHSRFAVPPGVLVLGGYDGQLSNSGEELILEDHEGNCIGRFEYAGDWYPLADGDGFSLTKHDPTGSPLSSWNKKTGWRASAYREGSPGLDDPGWGIAPGSIVINEILAYAPGQPDWIELYNTTDQDIALGGWFLSDRNNDDDRRRYYQISEAAMLPAGGYLVFYEDETFGNPDADGTLNPFGLSRFGETVYLFSGQDGQVTGHYYAEQPFGVSQPGLSFGRHYNQGADTWDFVTMSTPRPGTPNAAPAVGPVVIGQIMYHPPFGGAYDKEEYEYVELRNIAGWPVALSDYDAELDRTFGWKLSDAVEYEFPSGAVIQPGDVVVVVRNVEAFRSRYPDVPTERIFGPYSGRLNNSGERLDLLMPGQDDDGSRSYLRIDRVAYSNGSRPVGQDPWPYAANGGGMALRRIDETAYGNDAFNWQAVPSAPVQTPDRPVVRLVHYWHFNAIEGQIDVVPADYSLIGGATIGYPGSGDGYMDTTDGSMVNVRMGQEAGNCLRVRNPSDTRQLVVSLPTTGYEQIRLSYAVRRTPNGARIQQIEYRSGPTDTWRQIDEAVVVAEEYRMFAFDFSGVPEADNNPDFEVRIVFGGSHAAGTSGNNRFDNIALEGILVEGL